MMILLNFFNYLHSYKKIDIIINNAGINKIDDISNVDTEDWNRIFKVNLDGPFKLIKEVSPIMKNNYGRIINVSSIFGVVSKEKIVLFINKMGNYWSNKVFSS